MRAGLLVLFALSLHAAEYAAPAGTRTALRRPGALSILPGGRMVAPLGRQYITGPSPFGLAVSPNGEIVVSADGGPRRCSLSVLTRDGGRWLTTYHTASGLPEDEEIDPEWQSVFMGLAFESDKSLFASEGNSGKVRQIRPDSGSKQRVYDLNQGGFRDSYSGDLAFDRKRQLLYVVDQANYRVAIVDTNRRRVAGSVRVGRLPFALSLSPDGRRLWVANLGMFEYRPVPGSDPKRPRQTGLVFPPFGFPSEEARSGARRPTGEGRIVEVPGLGEPNVPESNSVAVVNVADPAAAKVEKFIRTGLPFGRASLGGSSPSGVLATAQHVFVSNAHNDSISVINPVTLEVEREIPLRIPGLEDLRGVLPLGLAFHEGTGWLFVAEGGINAIGVIDTRNWQVLGHLPVGWFPTRIAIDRDMVYVTNARGHGTGPNASRQAAHAVSFQAEMRRGTISMFPVPDADEVKRLTGDVLALNGFRPLRRPALALPNQIRHVVLIVKENRTYDEVFGDIQMAANGEVNGAWDLARFGRRGYVLAPRRELQSRLNMRNVDITPNHHNLADRWAFSDNFYADSEVSVDGHHWLVGTYPNAWTESSRMAGRHKDFRFPSTAPGRLQFMESNSSISPENQLEAGAIWHHFERHGVSFRNYGEGFELPGSDEGPGLAPTGTRYLVNIPMPEPLFRNTARDYPGYNTNIPDQYRAQQFIGDVQKRFIEGGEPFPQFVFIHLPNDHLDRPRPDDGYPFEASYMADNDLALGRIVEFLSHTPWWKQMAIFVTEDDAQGGVDHVDSHRTILLLISPYAKKNYASHVNSSFPGLLKTVFRLLRLPPLNLFDAAASDLADCFTATPDFSPYQAVPVPVDIFDPAKAKDPGGPLPPSTPMDDPRVLREQHQRMR